MDVLTFVVEMTKALVWPAIAYIILWRLRDLLPSVIERLSSLKLPGGTEAAFFEKKLDEAKTEAKQLGRTGPIATFDAAPDLDKVRRESEAFEELKQVSKDAAVLISFQAIEKGLMSLSARKSLPFAATPRAIVDEMEKSGIGNKNLIALLRHLIELKNAASHGARNVSAEQADSFKQLCDLAALRMKEIK